MKRLINLLIVHALICTNCWATTFYFSASEGNDSRSATEAQNPSTPWKTLDKLNSIFDQLRPGDFVLLKRGDTFYGQLNLSQSGSPSSPITIGAYGSGAKPVITGFVQISAWTSLGNGLYQAPVPGDLSGINMVTLNGSFEAMGRYPKKRTDYLNVDAARGESSISSNDLSNVPDFSGGEIVWRPNHWVLWRGTVTGQGGNSVRFFPFKSTSGGDVEKPREGFGFFFQNHPNACTVQGEWAYNSGTHLITMFFGGSGPGSGSVKVSSVNEVVTLQGSHYVTFDNLAISGSNNESFSITRSSHIKISACDILFSGRDAIVASKGCNDIAITGCNINYANSNGIVANGASSWNITGNSITNIAFVPGMGGSGEGQYFAIRDIGDNSLVKNNNVINTGYVPINFKGNNILIQNNFVDSFCTVKDDGGGIYFGGYSFAGSRVLGNIITNGVGAMQGTPDPESRAYGIYADDGASDVEIANNTAAFNGNAGIFNHNGHELNIHDNTFFDNKLTAIKYYNDKNTIANLAVTNNIFFAKTAAETILYSSGGSVSAASFFARADNNYWCRPLNENNIFEMLTPAKKFNLPGWKSFTGKEANSKTTPVAVTDVSKILFEYNSSPSNKVVTLKGTYIDVRKTAYQGSITLLPYTSVILIYSSGAKGNQAPVADAGPDQDFFLPVNSITLSGNGSDSDGTITSYQWKKISGPSQGIIVAPSEAQTIVNGLVAGTYHFELTVTDNEGAAASDTATITVKSRDGVSGKMPFVSAGRDLNIVLPKDSVRLNGSASDPDGELVSYHWRKVEGPACWLTDAAQLQTMARNLERGLYIFELSVKDDQGNVVRDSVRIIVDSFIVESRGHNPDASKLTDEKSPGTPSMRVYPNPVNDIFTLELECDYSGTVIIQIINTGGTVIRTFVADKEQNVSVQNYSVKDLASGIYFVHIQIGKFNDTRKIMKI